MSPATATLVSAGVVIAINLLTAAYVYGRLTERVKTHDYRLDRLEKVVFKAGD
jgi:hypothetical protein